MALIATAGAGGAAALGAGTIRGDGSVLTIVGDGLASVVRTRAALAFDVVDAAAVSLAGRATMGSPLEVTTTSSESGAAAPVATIG